MVKVTVKNPEFGRKGIWMFEQPEYFEYEGEEIKVKWVGDDSLALTTDIPDFPFRVIRRSLIVNVDGSAVKQTATPTRTVVVKGSKGQDYIVTLGASKSCTCPGFQFRKFCKHVNDTK